jgi:hypothetical protein
MTSSQGCSSADSRASHDTFQPYRHILRHIRQDPFEMIFRLASCWKTSRAPIMAAALSAVFRHRQASAALKPSGCWGETA